MATILVQGHWIDVVESSEAIDEKVRSTGDIASTRSASRNPTDEYRFYKFFTLTDAKDQREIRVMVGQIGAWGD